MSPNWISWLGERRTGVGGLITGLSVASSNAKLGSINKGFSLLSMDVRLEEVSNLESKVMY